MSLRLLVVLASSLPAFAGMRTRPVAIIPGQLPLFSVTATAPNANIAAAPSAAEDRTTSVSGMWEVRPPEVTRAFNSGDPRAYFEACEHYGYQPPLDDDDAQERLSQGSEAVRADEQATRQNDPSLSAVKRRVRKINYAAFEEALETGRALSPVLHHDRVAKEARLRIANYDSLTGTGGMPIPLENASNWRIGKVYESTLRAVERRARAKKKGED